MDGLYLIIAVIIILIALSCLADFNIGPAAVLAALLIGKQYMGFNTTKMLGMIPGSTVMTMIVLSAFYGFALENGTAHNLISKLLNRFGTKSAFLPVLVLILSALLSGIGLGSGNATMIMAPIALWIAVEAGIDPLIMAMAVSGGAAAGSNFPFSFGGAIAVSLIEQSGYLDDGIPAIMNAAARNGIIQIISFFLIYFAKKGYRNNGIAPENVLRMTSIQRKTSVVIVVVILGSVTPSILRVIYPCEFTKILAEALDINTVMLAGIVASMVLRLADEKKVVKHHVPWLLIVVVIGMSMLIGIARENGIVETLGTLLTSNIPKSLIVYVVILIGMIMSLFGGAISIVIPTLFPMVSGIAAGTGIDMGLLYGSILTGATCGGISPYSSGGMILLGAYPQQTKRKKLMKELMMMPFIQVLITGIVYAISR